MWRGLLISLVLIASAACAPQKTDKIKLTKKGPNGIVVIGVRALDREDDAVQTRRDEIRFGAYDPVSQRLIPQHVSMRPAFLHRRAGGFIAYHVLPFKPGSYVLASYHRDEGFGRRRTNCYHEDTIRFTVKPGDVLYLGNIGLIRDDWVPMPRNRAQALSELARYPYVDGHLLQDVMPARTQFESQPNQPNVFCPLDKRGPLPVQRPLGLKPALKAQKGSRPASPDIPG